MASTRPSKPREDFRIFVEHAALKPSVLSLIHTTDLFRFENILENGQLDVTEDKYFLQENLVYFFYGRPSYRVNPGIRKTRISSFAPISLVFKKDFPCNIKRVHPFDTGAFFSKRLESVIHPDLGLGSFEMRPNIDSARQIVGAFYGNNKKYMDSDPSNDIDLDELVKKRMLTVETYHQLIRYNQNDGTDERIHSIEIQSDRGVDLKGSLLAVVVPHKFFTDDQIRLITNAWGCKVVGYHFIAVYSPSDLMSAMFDKVKTVLLEDDQLS